MSAESASTRAVPYHCPYCAETDLWPHEPTGWECRGCRRAFQVQLISLIPAPVPTGTDNEGGA